MVLFFGLAVVCLFVVLGCVVCGLVRSRLFIFLLVAIVFITRFGGFCG